MLCRVCEKEMKFLEEVNGCVVGHASLRDNPFRMTTCKMSLFRCDNCSHVQAENGIPENYYDNYDLLKETEQVYYGSTSRIINERIKKLSLLGTNNNDSFVDIGCGRGDTLAIAKDYFKNCVGVEPSEKECEKATQRGLSVIQSYFDDSLELSQQFSTFFTSMVFEHLEDPVETLKHAYNSLEWGGVGLINVPNGQMIVRDKLYHQFLSEHINYWTPLSLSMMAYKAGFDVIRIEENDNLIELDLYLRKSIRKESMNEAKEFAKKRLVYLAQSSENIIVWGAGVKAHTYSGLIENIEIAHIVDSSVGKTGKYISGIDIPIELVTQEIVEQSDAVIIFATSYKDEIIQELKCKYRYKGKILYFDNNDIKFTLCEEITSL